MFDIKRHLLLLLLLLLILFIASWFLFTAQARDPRFDDLSGEFNESYFKQSYGFLSDIKLREKQVLSSVLILCFCVWIIHQNIHISLVQSVVLYGSETWTVRKVDSDRIQSFHMQALRIRWYVWQGIQCRSQWENETTRHTVSYCWQTSFIIWSHRRFCCFVFLFFSFFLFFLFYTVPLQCLWRDSVTLISTLLLTYLLSVAYRRTHLLRRHGNCQ